MASTRVGDERRTWQIVTNLVSNAVKYSPPDRPVTVKVERLDGEAVVSVEDEGDGMAESDQELAFARFGRLSNDSQVPGQRDGPVHRPVARRRARGAALGRIGGRPGIHVPTGAAGPGPVSTPRDPEALRVVVADDDPDQRLLIRELFARAGIADVHEAVDGGMAVSVVREVQPDLVVLDLAMPNRSGLEVLPDVREAAPEAHVVVLTNLPRWRLAPITRRLGATGFVEKRVPGSRLVSSILSAAALAAAVEATASSQFEADPRAPGQARAFVRGLLGDNHSELLGTVDLLVTELVTNAVLHASSTPTVDVYVGADNVRIAVHDDDPSLPKAAPARPGPGRRSRHGPPRPAGDDVGRRCGRRRQGRVVRDRPPSSSP